PNEGFLWNLVIELSVALELSRRSRHEERSSRWRLRRDAGELPGKRPQEPSEPRRGQGGWKGLIVGDLRLENKVGEGAGEVGCFRERKQSRSQREARLTECSNQLRRYITAGATAGMPGSHSRFDGRLRQLARDLSEPIAEPRAADRREVHLAATSPVETRVHLRLE